MPGGFPIKLLLLLQAKQSTCSQHLGPVAFYSCMEIYSTLFITPRRDLRNNHTCDDQHTPASEFHSHKKCCLTELEHWGGLGFAGSLLHYHKPPTSLPGSGSGTTKILLAFQRKPIQKDELCQGIPASFAQWRAETKGDMQCGFSNTEWNLGSWVSGKLVKCNLVPPWWNSWIRRTQNTSTGRAILSQKAWCSCFRAITVHCCPLLGAHSLGMARTSSGWHWG